MENAKENKTEVVKKKFTQKYGVAIMVVGLIAIIYILKFILEFLEK